MNIGNLKEGIVVKNYKELCKLLGLEPKKANSKKAQLKEMECYFSFHREGQKIIIDEIYKDKRIKEGMVFKNWIEICDIMGWETHRGTYKEARIKELKTICNYHKEGQKIIIDEVYPKPIPKEDGRVSKKINNYPNFKVDISEFDSIGVYKIELGNDIYIGSTVAGFRKRFQGHTFNHNTLPTKEMLENGATFSVLQNCDGMSEPEIRFIEDKWIEEYKNNPNYNLVNLRHAHSFTDKEQNKINKPKPPKYKSVKVNENDYEKLLLLIEENGIDIRL